MAPRQKVAIATEFKRPEPFTTSSAPGYQPLALVLEDAHNQAAYGKGKERHAQPGESFTSQVIFDGAKRFGGGALLFQAHKKAEESQRLPYQAARNELLGAIVYLAAAVIHLDNTQPVAMEATSE